jgi:hypothetical protein
MRAWLLLAAGAVVPLAACTGVSASHREDPAFAALRGQGYRIAIMPFEVSAPAEGFVEGALAPIGAAIALDGSGATPREEVGARMRADVAAWLAQGELEVVDPWQSDTVLNHAGMPEEARRDPANAAAIARMLAVDGVLFGDVSRWNRSYWVLQSTAEVALRVRLIDGGSGRELFAGERHETVGSGLTGGPTGYVSAATEPLAGLRGAHLRELVRSVARGAAADLNGGRPAAEAGPGAPQLAFVAPTELAAGAPFRAGDRVEVTAVGTPDCDVRFDLGRLRTGVPMRQVARHDDPRGARATYVGHYVVQPGDVAGGLPLQCTIRRSAGQRTAGTRYRWEGMVALAGR